MINKNVIRRSLMYYGLSLPLLKVFLSTFFKPMYHTLSWVCYILLAILLFLNIRDEIKRITVFDIAIYSFLLTSFFLSGFFSEYNKSISSEIFFDLLQTCLVGFISTRFIYIQDIDISKFRFLSYLSCVGMAVCIILFPIKGKPYYMTYAYNLLYGFILLSVPLAVDYSLLDMLVSFCYFSLLLACGTRGPLLIALLLYVVTQLAFGRRGRKIVLNSIMAIFAVVFLLFLNPIIGFLQGLLKINLSFRILEKVRSGSLLSGSGRLEIYKEAVKYISSHLILGCGITNDRIVLSRLLGEKASTGSYVHNIYLEWCMQFGMVFGTILFLIFILSSVKCLKKIRHQKTLVAFYISLFFDGVISLLFSRSYLISFSFFAFLGLILNRDLSSKNAKIYRGMFV